MKTEIESLLNQQKFNQAEIKLHQYVSDDSSLDVFKYGVKKYQPLADALNYKKVKVAILRTITIESIMPFLKIKSFEKRIDTDLYFGDYNIIDQEIFDKNSTLYSFNPDILILFLCIEQVCPRLIYSFHDLTIDDINEQIDSVVNRIEQLVSNFRENNDAKIIVHNFEIPTFPANGIADVNKKNNQKNTIITLNKKIKSVIHKYVDVYLLDYDQVLARHGKKKCFDEKYWYLAKAPLSTTGLKALSDEYIRYFVPLLGLTKKCIVLDLDNTLWGGIVGELGVEGITLGKNYTGKAFLDFQKELLKLHKKGILLAINSKNNFDDAMEVFEKHPDIILKKDHFASMKINWNNKAENMQDIARDLNIDMNSFVFFDDNPIERELIKTKLPQIHTVDLPDNPFNYSQIVKELPDFEMLHLSNEDMNRGKMYQDQIRRKKLKDSSSSLEDFYRSLDMVAIIKKDERQAISRLTKMTQKINQFNLTTIRYSKTDIARFLDLDSYRIYSLRLFDKFGDNGIVGQIIIEDKKDIWEIDSFLMSCRVIGRTVETAFLWFLFKEAKLANVNKIIGKYIPSKKNKPVEQLYNDHGFKLVEEVDNTTIWEMHTEKNNIKCPEWIKINGE